jgi:hypothetical protein
VLLSFTVENFRSYREAKTLSLVASKGSELPGNTRSVAGVPLQVLTSAVLYGANGSGKSNLLVAIGYLRSELLRAGINDLGRPTGTFHDRRQRFLLDPEWATRPTRFEIAFLLNGVLHQYDITFHQGAVREERLRVTPNGRVQTWFRRQGQEFVDATGIAVSGIRGAGRASAVEAHRGLDAGQSGGLAAGGRGGRMGRTVAGDDRRGRGR